MQFELVDKKDIWNYDCCVHDMQLSPVYSFQAWDEVLK